MDDHRKRDSGPIRGTPYIRTTSWSASVGIGGSSRTVVVARRRIRRAAEYRAD